MVQILFSLAWLLFHVLIHEAGHVLAALFVGSKVKRIGFNKFGVFVQRSPASSVYKDAFVALAGPAANIYTWLFMASYHVHGASFPLILGILNLLPIPNSDSMKALRYIQSSRQNSLV